MNNNNELLVVNKNATFKKDGGVCQELSNSPNKNEFVGNSVKRKWQEIANNGIKKIDYLSQEEVEKFLEKSEWYKPSINQQEFNSL